MKIRERVALAPLTTFEIGGEARYFVETFSIEETIEALKDARERALPVFILGGGSNILVSDDGFDGLVLSPRLTDISLEQKGDTSFVTTGAGVSWDDFVLFAIENNLSGLECLSGVPGTVGGAVVANVGAYGEQCSDTIVFVDVIDRTSEEGAVRTMKREECGFSYHDSIFSQEQGRYVVLRATFALARNGSTKLSYRDSRFNLTSFIKGGKNPALADVREAVLSVREQKGTLIMEGRTSFKSAGSFFHMPVVNRDTYDNIVNQARALDAIKEERLRPWAWEQKDGSYKIAPGFLIEYTEFQKGYTRGQVGISPRHTLSIINLGKARAKDVAALARDVQNEVRKIFSVQLVREVEYVGRVE